MLKITLILLICQHMSSIATTTRLPLEVYELTQAATAANSEADKAKTTTAAAAAVVSTTTTTFSNAAEVERGGAAGVSATAAAMATYENLNLKHKNLEYATINAKAALHNKLATTATTKNATKTLTSSSSGGGVDAAAALTGDIDDIIESTTILTVLAATNERNNDNFATQQQHNQQEEEEEHHQQQQEQHRRSRQMLNDDILEREADYQHVDALHLQKLHHIRQQQQQMQHQSHKYHNKDISLRKHTVVGGTYNTKDVRILYQVGDSEDDLPICAPNAVCSKIDLYETPWIERQCRCPEVNRAPQIIIHHHHHNHQQQQQQQQHNSHNNHHQHNKEQQTQKFSDKFRSFYEHEKMIQRKHLLLGDFNDKKFDSLHMKKLIQKLGAVYEDDLSLHSSDFLAQDDNDALPSISTEEEIDEDQHEDSAENNNNNEFPYGARHSYYTTNAAAGGGATTHMRHSAHNMAHKARETSFIGGCPSGLGIEDGHTIADKTRHYKLCQSVHKLPVCKHFRDYTWTLTTSAELNVTEQIVHCRCPKNSVTYLTKREPATDGSNGYTYLFACSPLTRIRCQRKQPCKLFTVRKRQEFLDEVNINALCQCPKGHHCPSHHTQSGVIPGESFLEDNIQTYSGYCMAND